MQKKLKNNSYSLTHDKEKNVFIVEFVDSKNLSQKVEVSEDVYNAFYKFRLEDMSQSHKYRRHIEHSELAEETLYQRTLHKPVSVEEQVELYIFKENLDSIISSLPEIQKRRLQKYFYDNKTLEQIAHEEHCTKRAVKFTIDIALEKISKKFKN